jgi:two-component system cell cycle response regulator
MYGPGMGRRYPLSGTVNIGRDAENTIVVDSHDVSRRHAELRLIRDRWFINDLLSTNGTEVNGRPIEGETILSNGDLVNVGGVIFKFIAGGNLEALFHEEVYRMTVFDGLTGLHNRRFLMEFLDRELARSRRHGRPLSLAMIDVDHFKRINDEHGHLAGDHVLSVLGPLLNSKTRRDELVARWGGEEFAFVLPEAGVDEARQACEILRSLVESEPFRGGGETLRLTVSIGVAQFDPSMSADALVEAADRQLYQAKQAGRNCVRAAE